MLVILHQKYVGNPAPRKASKLGMSWGTHLLTMKAPALGVLWLLKGQRGAQQVAEGQDQSS